MTENRSEEISQETVIEYGAVDKNDRMYLQGVLEGEREEKKSDEFVIFRFFIKYILSWKTLNE